MFKSGCFLLPPTKILLLQQESQSKEAEGVHKGSQPLISFGELSSAVGSEICQTPFLDMWARQIGVGIGLTKAVLEQRKKQNQKEAMLLTKQQELKKTFVKQKRQLINKAVPKLMVTR